MITRFLALPVELRHKIWELAFGLDAQDRPRRLILRPGFHMSVLCKMKLRLHKNRSTPLLVVNRRLGIDAHVWLFAKAERVRFSNADCFYKFLATRTDWGPLRFAKTIEFPHTCYGSTILDLARRFRERMNQRYPGDVVDIDWDISYTSLIKRQSSNAAEKVFPELGCLLNVLPKDFEEGEQGRRTIRGDSSDT